jgi:hypothetical protein
MSEKLHEESKAVQVVPEELLEDVSGGYLPPGGSTPNSTSPASGSRQYQCPACGITFKSDRCYTPGCPLKLEVIPPMSTRL